MENQKRMVPSELNQVVPHSGNGVIVMHKLHMKFGNCGYKKRFSGVFLRKVELKLKF